ncbi:MAG TPA: M48 family metalloprotease [Usitatibacter sp.]|jgi:predicted Zn-dependent protease|nr:M48 family metalloprotease [Usitatibacter sp.]
MRRILLAVALSAASAALAQLPFDLGRALDVGKKLVDSQKTTEMSESEEIGLGDALTAGFLGASPLHPDANLQRYVNRVGKWCAMHSDRPDLPWSFAVIDTETINAFALPGGDVIVSSGLLKRLSSESELAGVLSHEIAHVVKKHQLQAIQSSQRGNLLASVGKDIASDRIASRGGSALGQAAKTGLANVATDLLKDGLLLRPLDRSMEYEADQLGVVIATRSGYDPYGLVGALQMLAQYKGGADAASIMSTHPPASDRISELERYLPNVERYSSHPQLEGRYRQVVGAAK